MNRISSPIVHLAEATVDYLDEYERDPALLGRALGVRMPGGGYPEFPEAFAYVRELLAEHPGQGGWWMYFFIDRAAGALVGSGGYKGPPADGLVEIGYEIAPEFRGSGYASEAARLLVTRALEHDAVQAVQAHTLPEENASTAVLVKCGFVKIGTVTEVDAGDVWQWRFAP